MTKFYDEDGKEVEAFTKEELDAEIEKKKKADEEAAAKKAEEDAAAKKAQEDAAKAKEQEGKKTEAQLLAERLERLEKQNQELRVEKIADQFAGNDQEKRKSFISKFDRLTGYEETPEGLAERAADAARLAFGSDAGIDTAGLGNAGGRNVNDAKQVQTTQQDKDIQSVLGISEADAKKYGSNGDNK